MKPEPRARPLLSLRKAAWVVLIGMVGSVVFVRLALQLNLHPWSEIAICSYFLGHSVLAITLIRGRLRIQFPFDYSWVDGLTVASAPWVGSLVWYHEWKKANTG